jgi:hypothetical protein
MNPWDLLWNPNGPLTCQAQVFYAYRDRAQYQDSYEQEITPNMLAQCVTFRRGAGVFCPEWWAVPGDDYPASDPQLPPGARLLNVRYYVYRNMAWHVVPWAEGQKFVGDRGSWDSLLTPANYTGRPVSQWASKHGIVPRGSRLIIRSPIRSA